MNTDKKIREILADYFTSKNNLIQYFERDLAYHEFHKTTNQKNPKEDIKLGYIVHKLSRSSTIEMDMCGAKKQGNEYVLFFEFSFRLNSNLIAGEFEAGDDGVHLGKINCFSDFERIDFTWLDEQHLHNFRKWLFNSNY
jgi:hypothetical protein